MKKREVRLYNMIIPVWLLWIFPQVWLLILPGNLLIDTAVLLCALLVLGRRDRGRLGREMPRRGALTDPGPHAIMEEKAEGGIHLWNSCSVSRPSRW